MDRKRRRQIVEFFKFVSEESMKMAEVFEKEDEAFTKSAAVVTLATQIGLEWGGGKKDGDACFKLYDCHGWEKR